MHANIPENINPFSPVFIGTDSKLQKISVRSSVQVQHRKEQPKIWTFINSTLNIKQR